MSMPIAQRILYALADFFCGSPVDSFFPPPHWEPESEERAAQLDVFEYLLTGIGVIGAVVSALLFPSGHLF